MSRFAVVAWISLCIGAAPSAAAADRAQPGLAPVIARISQSVVLVRTWSDYDAASLPRPTAFDRFFSGNRQAFAEREAVGTAFVVDPAAGLLVTSDYMVRDTVRVEVTLPGGETRTATVVGYDEASGVGLLRVAPEGLVALEWSESEPVIGDPAILVAHVMKKGPVATVGIVSGRDHSPDGLEIPYLFLDVAVQRGAAGGVVATPDGRVFAMAYGSYGQGLDPYASLGIAVPASEMRPVIDMLASDGRVLRSWIGVAVTLGRFRRGARIVEVHDDSPAGRAGLSEDEEIVAVNGQAIRDDQELRRVVARSPVGATLVLSVDGHDGDQREVSLVTVARSD